MKRFAVGYVRVSTALQRQEGLSVDMQIDRIKKYCTLNDLDLAAIYGDPGISAKNMRSRPGIQAIMQLVRRKKVGHVIIYKLDRLARNVREALEIAELLDKKGIQLHSITERIDTGSATGRLFFNLLAAMAAWERELASERTVAALAQKKSRGEKTGGQAPYGYRCAETIQPNNGKPLKLLQPDTAEQALIVKVKAFRAEGLSTRKIADALNGSGYTTRKGTRWTQNHILRLLA